MLEKGWIDDNDFAQPQLPLEKHHQNEYPVFGNWKAEASAREVSLIEALEIISDNGSVNQGVCQKQRRWRSLFEDGKEKNQGSQALRAEDDSSKNWD